MLRVRQKHGAVARQVRLRPARGLQEVRLAPRQGALRPAEKTAQEPPGPPRAVEGRFRAQDQHAGGRAVTHGVERPVVVAQGVGTPGHAPGPGGGEEVSRGGKSQDGAGLAPGRDRNGGRTRAALPDPQVQGRRGGDAARGGADLQLRLPRAGARRGADLGHPGVAERGHAQAHEGRALGRRRSGRGEHVRGPVAEDDDRPAAGAWRLLEQAAGRAQGRRGVRAAQAGRCALQETVGALRVRPFKGTGEPFVEDPDADAVAAGQAFEKAPPRPARDLEARHAALMRAHRVGGVEQDHQVQSLARDGRFGAAHRGARGRQHQAGQQQAARGQQQGLAQARARPRARLDGGQQSQVGEGQTPRRAARQQVDEDR